MLKKFAPLIILAVMAAAWNFDLPAPAQVEPPAFSDDADAILAQAFEDKANELMVSGSGRVLSVLRDDNKGSRHQRFLIELASGQSILVAHNIDLAPRVANIRKGDRVEFRGMYEWNDRGGVIHWTHHDPKGKFEGGWISHNGQRYE